MSRKEKKEMELEKVEKIKKEVLQKVTAWIMKSKTIAGLLDRIAISTVCGHPCGMDSILCEISENLGKKYGLNLNSDFYMKMDGISDGLLKEIDPEKIKKDLIKSFIVKVENCESIEGLASIVILANNCKKDCTLKKFEALGKKLEEVLKKFNLEIDFDHEIELDYEINPNDETDLDHETVINHETDSNYQIEFNKIKKDLIELFTNKIQEFKTIGEMASLYHHGDFDDKLEYCKLGDFVFDTLYDNGINESTHGGLMLLEELEHVDLEKAKRDVIDTFTNIIKSCNTIKDLIFLLYQEPCCGHPCGPSDMIMDILFKNGIDEGKCNRLMHNNDPGYFEEDVVMGDGESSTKSPQFSIKEFKKKYKLKSDDISRMSDGLTITINDKGLEEIPEELQYFEGLTTLILAGNRITNMAGIERLHDLKKLNMYDNKVQKIEGLENAENLKELRLGKNEIIRIEGLEKLDFLHELDLSENNISKMEGLDKLESLHILYLDKNNITKIEGLENLTELTTLSLENNRIKKLEGLDSLKKLGFLYLKNNEISRIEGLTNLKELCFLDLSHNEIEKIEGLESLKELDTLYLYNNNIRRIEGLKGLTNLSRLNLSKNNIERMEGLENLEQLRDLNISNNKIKQIEGLENLKQLYFLSLFNNKIERIEGLENLKQIDRLSLFKNKIERIEGLGDLKTLRFLILYKNRIERIEGLESLKRLEWLDLTNNKIGRLEGIYHLKKLEKLFIKGNPIKVIENIKFIKKIKDLSINSLK